MENDKLEKAAKQDAIHTVIGDLYERGNYEMGFVSGAEWLMGQPLSERLTEDERKDYINGYIYTQKMIDYYSSNPAKSEFFKGQRMILESIFGKEMFEK